MSLITCPYCMETYDSNAVHFRVSAPLDRRNIMNRINEVDTRRITLEKTDVKNQNEIDSLSKVIDQLNRLKNVSLQMCMRDIDNPDPYLKKYYDELRIDIRNTNDPRVYMPFIDFSNTMLLYNEDVSAACIRDKSGMLIGVKDYREKINNIRLCPHCHNELPENYGLNDTVFMSVIGITQSGKTVYLSSFLRDLEEELAYAGLTLVSASKSVNDFLVAYPIEQGRPLPMGTVAAKPSEPLIFNIRTADEKNHTIVLFDIAGENCVDAQQMKIYGKFIKKSSGIIMLIDPHQFSEIGGKIVNDMDLPTANMPMAEPTGLSRTTPTKVLQTIHDAFFGNGDDKIQIPVALTVGKFDQLACMSDGSNNLEMLFNSIEVPDTIPANSRSAYYMNKFKTDATNKHQILRRFISSDRSGFTLVNHLDKLYAKTMLFAASALGEGSHYSNKEEFGMQKILDTQPVPFGIYNPFFWILFNSIKIDNIAGSTGRSNGNAGGEKRVHLFDRFRRN